MRELPSLVEPPSTWRSASQRPKTPSSELNRRELIARIELDERRLADEMSTLLAEQIAAREAALVERIESLVNRKLGDARRVQTQRVRSTQALVGS